MSNKEINADQFTMVEENKEDFKESKIERSGITTEFTPKLVEEHKRELEKVEREVEGQIKVCKATMDNIERNYDFVKELTEEQRHHVWMYYENETVHKEAETKLPEIKKQLEQYKELLDTIYTKFGFVASEIDEQEKGDTKE